jgi:MFS superfamily sulfate permease-like transporter
MANIASGLFWWLPVTAVFVRTSLNIQSGWKSRYSAFLIWVFTLIFSLLLFNKGFMFLPYPIIAAILINIALWLIDIKHLKELYKIRHGAFYIALITAFFTVAEDATFWIVIWTLIALVIYLKRVTSSGAKVSVFRDGKYLKKADFGLYAHKKQQDWDIILLKFDWWLNYLNQEKNIHHLELLNKKITVILSFAHMWYLDIDWIEAINDNCAELMAKWIEIYFSWLEWSYEQMMSHTKVYKKLHKEGKIISSATQALHNLLWDWYHTF